MTSAFEQKHTLLPTPRTEEELLRSIRLTLGAVDDENSTLGVQTDGYSKAVEALGRVADLAYRYAASALDGLSGAQASMGALVALGYIRTIDGPFRISDAEHLLYPQYDEVAQVKGWIESEDMREWLADEAQKKIDEFNNSSRSDFVNPRVWSHWEALVALRPKN